MSTTIAWQPAPTIDPVDVEQLKKDIICDHSFLIHFSTDRLLDVDRADLGAPRLGGDNSDREIKMHNLTSGAIEGVSELDMRAMRAALETGDYGKSLNRAEYTEFLASLELGDQKVVPGRILGDYDNPGEVRDADLQEGRACQAIEGQWKK